MLVLFLQPHLLKSDAEFAQGLGSTLAPILSGGPSRSNPTHQTVLMATPLYKRVSSFAHLKANTLTNYCIDIRQYILVKHNEQRPILDF